MPGGANAGVCTRTRDKLISVNRSNPIIRKTFDSLQIQLLGGGRIGFEIASQCETVSSVSFSMGWIAAEIFSTKFSTKTLVFLYASIV